ncbi:Uncharacterised protein [Salmonella enterica subsp. enterica]|uniref:Uncharacterized protein n=2 Tax=Salmonella enterica I TaxID=59201 RepID=A0A447TQH6_SALET|nr:Uncharacterised protein [Salmonella enterica subsp. enterica]
MDGITRSGSAAAKGIAPSVTPTQPMTSAALPASRSSTEKFLRPISVASPSPSGGTQMLTAAIATTVYTPCATQISMNA